MSFNISSNFFNSMLGRSSGNSNSMTGLLSDYNSIRNGSYLKLAKHIIPRMVQSRQHRNGFRTILVQNRKIR